MFFKFLVLLTLIFNFGHVKSEIVKKIEIQGNERISTNTILMFSEINIGDDLDNLELNSILKNLYNTNFFENINVNLNKNVLTINVQENPIIEQIVFTGVKAKKIKKLISQNLILKSRSSYNEILLKNDKEKIKESLKSLGYFFSEIDVFIEKLNDNKIKLNYKIDIGEKSKIKKISFIGPKIFKDNKLRSVIVSEEYKFWKFISGKKFLNENSIALDEKLLKNFYLSRGYYDVEINSSYAKLINNNEFELIFSINPKSKFFFNEVSLTIPADFNDENFKDLKILFEQIKGQPYSLNYISDMLDEIDNITTKEEFHSVKSTVNEEIIGDQINLDFNIIETEKFFVEKINIFGNNITAENVIRNNLEIDEGDPYNEILEKKSVNNLKSMNFFKKVSSEVLPGSSAGSKIINYTIEEKPTGEISAGAGVGTSGGTIGFGVKENNYLGKGISLEANATLTEESVKGLLNITNPNFKNSDKSVSLTIEATEVDRLSDFGYKNDKIGFSIGTQFEYLDDFNFGLSTSSYYEKVETNSNASALQKKLTGDYWDTFLRFSFDLDKRNQNYQTSDGFRSRYFLDLPIISDTNTLTNTYDYKLFTELYEENITTASIFIKTANSISNDDIKLSERLYVPSSKLRGFEKSKIGPLDNGDFIGGNYVAAINFSSTIPQILENAQDVDIGIFLDAANVWGVDYNSSLDSSEIRSAVGVGVDWFTFLGPLNFTLALPLTKESTDKTESFRFNIGTTF